MRIPARLTTTAVGVAALTASLTGCMTVHGAEAVVPAVSEDEAREVLDHYAEVKNEVNPAYDAELNNSIDRGTLGAINEAMHAARDTVHPDGNPDYEPLEFVDPSFHIPQQQGWPKFFVVDAPTNRSDSHHWLLTFSRDSPEEDWRASYMASVAAELVPEFASDEDGYAEAVAPEESIGGGSAPALGELSEAYSSYLAEGGEGPFADGNHTSGVLEQRAEANRDPASAVQYIDNHATEEEYAPVGLHTEDGGALAFFTSHHSDQEDWADGETPVIDQYVEAVLEDDARQTVVTQRLGMQAALLPADEAPVTVIARIRGVLDAQGS